MVPHLKALYKRGQIKGRLFGSFGKVERLLPPLVLVLGMLALAMLSFSWRADELPANTDDTASSTATTTGTATTTTTAVTATDTIPDSGDLDLETVRATIKTEGAVRADTATVGEQGPLRLLLASHSRLFWYEPDTKITTVLHEGEGVHYGVIPGEGGSGPDDPLTSVWFALRPHNWHPQSSEEFLVEVDTTTGTEISRTKIFSRFTHDVARVGDRVFICSTESGEVVQLDYPTMLEVRRMALFTRQQHVNSLAPLSSNSLWAMLHNLGSSTLVRVSWRKGGEPSVVGVIEEVGTKAHAIVEWREWLLLLDSDEGALVRVRKDWEVPVPASGWHAGAAGGKRGGQAGRATRAGKAKLKHAPEIVYQVPDSFGKFLKGLCVVADVAYFGVSEAKARHERDSLDANSELVAVDLLTGKLLWQEQVPTHGLLNIIAAPHISPGSTYRAIPRLAVGPTTSRARTAVDDTAVDPEAETADAEDRGSGHADQQEAVTDSHRGRTPGDGSKQLQRQNAFKISARSKGLKGRQKGGWLGWLGFGRGKAVDEQRQQRVEAAQEEMLSGIDDDAVREITRQLIDTGFPPLIGGHWPTQAPYLDLPTKRGPVSWDAGIQLPLMQLDVSKLRVLMESLPHEMWTDEYQREHNAAVSGRDGNMAKFKPGVFAMYLIFSDRTIQNTYIYPFYDYFKEVLEPIIEKIIGASAMRKIVRLQFANMPPGTVIHIHRDMGGYAQYAHRIHIPIVASPDVAFEVCPGFEKRTTHSHVNVVDSQVSEPGDCVNIPMGEGMVFELNNRVLHRVLNHSPNVSRIQLVIDVAEEDKPVYRLQPGTQCEYVKGVVHCPEGTMTKV